MTSRTTDATTLRRAASDLIRHGASGLPMDWAIVLLPTVLAIRTFSAAASLLFLGLLCFSVYARRTQLRLPIQPGPSLLLVAASVIVLLRPQPTGHFIFFVLVSILVARLVITVKPRVIIASIIDGAGLYLVVNVLAYMLGLRAARAGDRIGDYVQSSGFVSGFFSSTFG